MTTSAAHWFLRQSGTRRALLRALPVALVAYLTALLGGVVAETLKADGGARFAVVTGVVLVVVILFVLIVQALAQSVTAIQEEEGRRQTFLNAAHESADRWLRDEVSMLTEMSSGQRPITTVAPADPVDAMKRLVESAYEALTAHYGQSSDLQTRIDFEVTFMTKSYVDNAITYPFRGSGSGGQQ